jgi:glycine dehydrogenase subunit 2
MNNVYYGKLIFELSKEGRKGYSLPANELKEYKLGDLPHALLREEAPALPEVDEVDGSASLHQHEQQQLWR